jgi:hypothetical protein
MGSGKVVAALALLALSALPAASQSSSPEKPDAIARAEVLVLGVFHMANPGRDIVNSQVDDVLSPRRQAEIAELIAVLKKFQPTRIAVEAPFNGAVTAKRYSDYLTGKHELTRDETQQVGFRLARELGHKTVFAVDVDGEFPFPRLVDYAKANGRVQEHEAIMADVGGMVKAQDAYLASHTILETLLYLNADEKVAEATGYYFRQAHLGEPWNWAGADLVADWFRRNMRIFTNIVRLADSPNERVLVIYGAGHLGWLRQAFASDPTIRLRTLAELVQ